MRRLARHGLHDPSVQLPPEYEQLPSAQLPDGDEPEHAALTADSAAPTRSAAAFAAAPLVTGTETSTSGFTSIVGVAVCVSVEPDESAEAIAPSPMTMLT